MKIASTILLAFLFLATSDEKALLTAKYCGYYYYSWPEVVGAFRCADIYPETDTTVLFFLAYNRGAPTYGSGQLYGRAHLVNGCGWYGLQDSDNCRFRFRVSQDSLTIDPMGAHFDCHDFSFHGIADGVYLRQNVPCQDYFFDESADSISFISTPPEKYAR